MIAGDIEIHSTYLTNLHDLNNLITVGGTVHIFSNYSLTSLDLNNLNAVGANFWIVNNPILPTALVTALRDQVLAGGGIGNEIMVCGNQGGQACN
jgi:hypothetical protein